MGPILPGGEVGVGTQPHESLTLSPCLRSVLWGRMLMGLRALGGAGGGPGRPRAAPRRARGMSCPPRSPAAPPGVSAAHGSIARSGRARRAREEGRPAPPPRQGWPCRGAGDAPAERGPHLVAEPARPRDALLVPLPLPLPGTSAACGRWPGSNRPAPSPLGVLCSTARAELWAGEEGTPGPGCDGHTALRQRCLCDRCGPARADILNTGSFSKAERCAGELESLPASRWWEFACCLVSLSAQSWLAVKEPRVAIDGTARMGWSLCPPYRGPMGTALQG